MRPRVRTASGALVRAEASTSGSSAPAAGTGLTMFCSPSGRFERDRDALPVEHRRQTDAHAVGRHDVVAARRQTGAGAAVPERDGDRAVVGASGGVDAGVGGLPVEGGHLGPAHARHPDGKRRLRSRRRRRADVGEWPLAQRHRLERRPLVAAAEDLGSAVAVRRPRHVGEHTQARAAVGVDQALLEPQSRSGADAGLDQLDGGDLRHRCPVGVDAGDRQGPAGSDLRDGAGEVEGVDVGDQVGQRCAGQCERFALAEHVGGAG